MSIYYYKFEEVSSKLASECSTKALRLFQEEFLRVKLMLPEGVTAREILEHLYQLSGRALDIRERRN